MGCGCSLCADQAVTGPSSASGRTNGNSRSDELEFTAIPVRDDGRDAPKAVYCPPPPDWALNEHGVERKVASKQQTQLAGSAEAKSKHRNHWRQLINGARSAAYTEEAATAERSIENWKADGEKKEQIQSESGDMDSNERVVSVPQARGKDIADALSRPRSVQSIPVTMSLELETVSQKVPFHRSRNNYHQSRQAALDEPVIVSHYGQYSTLV